ncbi:MAG: MarR family transcriptional regulator [Steroidobacteraceae bacterium]
MRSLYDDLERMTDASVGAHRALAVIASDGGLQASQLAARLGMRPPAVSQLLRLLVARGWVSRRRGAADQRIVRIYLTAAGRRVVSATSGRAVGVLYRAVRALSVDDLERLARSVPELVQRLPKSASGRPGA